MGEVMNGSHSCHERLPAPQTSQTELTPDKDHVGSVWEGMGEDNCNAAMGTALRETVIGLEIRSATCPFVVKPQRNLENENALTDRKISKGQVNLDLVSSRVPLPNHEPVITSAVNMESLVTVTRLIVNLRSSPF